jgi:hypothetical protein
MAVVGWFRLFGSIVAADADILRVIDVGGPAVDVDVRSSS